MRRADFVDHWQRVYAGRCVLVYTDHGDVALPAAIAALPTETLVTVAAQDSELADDVPQRMAPYDGGTDIIVERQTLRDELRRHYAGWLSTHPSGT